MHASPVDAVSDETGTCASHVFDRWRKIEFLISGAIGLISFGVYVLTLCPVTYPGPSAQCVAKVLQLLPQSTADHPVWRLAAQAFAKIPLFELPLRLNLFSALCGALSVALLFRLASRVLFELIPNEPQSYYTSADETETTTDDRASVSLGTTEALSALIGGLLTALAFAFGAPFWSASTSLHPQTFDLLLFLVMAMCLARYIYTGSIIAYIGCVFLLSLGLAESVLFVAILPVVLYFLFRAGREFDHISESFTLLFFVAGLVGIGAGLAALFAVAGTGAPDLPRLLFLLSSIARSHQADLLQGLPHMGWLLVLLETILPFAAVFGGASKFLNSHEPLTRWLWCLLNVIFTFVAVACLLGLPYTPWAFARQGEHTPVIPSLATALSLGILYTFWRLTRSIPQLTYESEDYYTPPPRTHKLLSYSMTFSLVAVVLAAPCRNLGDADGRKGAFADTVARTLIAQLGDATCLVTDRGLDWNLLVQAHLQRRKLTLVQEDVEAGAGPSDAPAKSKISPEPRKRKAPPKKETPREFVERWVRTNPGAFSQVAVMSAPSIWTRAGLFAVPSGLVYLGTADRRTVNGPALLKKHEELWQSLAPLLSKACRQPPALVALNAGLNRHASRVANDLGVFLEDQGCRAEADRAYAQALSLDADNLCALFNRYGLWLCDAQRGRPAELEDQIRAASERFKRGFLFERCMASYGSMHGQPADLLTQLNATAENPLVVQWIAYCQSQASAGVRPPADTSPGAKSPGANGTSSLAQIIHAIRAGESADAERRLRAFLEAQPDNLAGWSILADLLFTSGRVEEAATLALPAMRKAAGEKGDELVDMAEGLCALQQSPPRPRDARTFFMRALAHRPGLKEAQDQLLRADRVLSDAALLESDALAILKSDANHCEANAILGSVRLSEKRLDEAEKHLRKSVATLPTAGALNDLAELLRKKQRLDEAEKFARHALRLEPGFYQAWDTLGAVLADQNRLNEADSALRCAISLCAKDPRLHLNLVRLNLKLKRTDEARQNLAHAQPMVAGSPSSVGKDFDALTRELDALTSHR